MSIPGTNPNQWQGGATEVDDGKEKGNLSVGEGKITWDSLTNEPFAGESVESNDSQNETVNANKPPIEGEQKIDGGENKEQKNEKFVQEKADFIVKTFVARGMRLRGKDIIPPNDNGKIPPKEDFKEVSLKALKPEFEEMLRHIKEDDLSEIEAIGNWGHRTEANGIKELIRIGYCSGHDDFEQASKDFEEDDNLQIDITSPYDKEKKKAINWRNPENKTFLRKGILEVAKMAPASVEKLYDEEYGEVIEDDKLDDEIMEVMGNW